MRLRILPMANTFIVLVQKIIVDLHIFFSVIVTLTL